MPEPRTPRQVPPPPPAVTEPEVPPYYVATENLPYTGPGGVAVLAFAAGDHVPPDLVESCGWGGLVEVPAQFRGVLPPPGPPPSGGEEKE